MAFSCSVRWVFVEARRGRLLRVLARLPGCVLPPAFPSERPRRDAKAVAPAGRWIEGVRRAWPALSQQIGVLRASCLYDFHNNYYYCGYWCFFATITIITASP